ncbi:3'-5' exonuclease [Paenibacillus silvae]|uniref:3'-5' exonuclease n=1 Tax=Paenibacillus silvae TaxID=1325358 RepID=UPI0020039018|nr:3'-5' exonuclease [Paenibacillus silvae]MCK6073784.1 3'-5' exonuclease [Paenibacillus silvae]MCK6148740.1 3'-5' exonuclease [Paenibacillus silvae]MCK6267040.1 3'-5' exonuclease [Paenibacillus silvae]
MKITFESDTYTVEGFSVTSLQDRMYCIFDLEGTGIDIAVESVTQFGAMYYKRGEAADKASFASLVRACKPIPEAVEKLTGIKNEAMLQAPHFEQVYKQFCSFIGDQVLVTHAGYEYDLPMLERHCKQFGLMMFTNKVLDTKAMFTYIHPEVTDVVSTDFLIHYYNLNTEGIHRHDALEDCGIIARIFECVLEEYEQRGVDHFTADSGKRMKRFVIPEMYLTKEKGD